MKRHNAPIVVGSLIAAGGLVLGGLVGGVNASARSGNVPAAAKHHGEPANITLVKNDIVSYYGDVQRAVPEDSPIFQYTGPIEHLPAPDAPYAKDVGALIRKAKAYMTKRLHSWPKTSPAKRSHGTKKPATKPAVVFDVDDTLLNGYNYERATDFSYKYDVETAYINAAAYPAVPGMPEFMSWASKHGFTVLLLTGRSGSQRDVMVTNLRKDGYDAPMGLDRAFMKDHNSYQYLDCSEEAGAANPCKGLTTVQFKSGMRKYFESQGFTIVANFGDQFSDLQGGHAETTYKLPNPLYFVN